MAVAARTAPKVSGQDYLDIHVLAGDEMDKFGQDTGKINFDRDAENIGHSGAALFVALRDNHRGDLIVVPVGRICVIIWRVIKERNLKDRFVPGGWWTLVLPVVPRRKRLLNADNLVMYRPAVMARKMGLVEGAFVCTIPIAASGKNIYFNPPVK